ncbi:MAG: hypothetical protein AB7U61_07110 [Methylocystis sp.]
MDNGKPELKQKTPPPYAQPLRIRRAAESFVVEDAHGKALAYVYFEDEPSGRKLVNRLSGADAKAAALTAEAVGARSRRRRRSELYWGDLKDRSSEGSPLRAANSGLSSGGEKSLRRPSAIDSSIFILHAG